MVPSQSIGRVIRNRQNKPRPVAIPAMAKVTLAKATIPVGQCDQISHCGIGGKNGVTGAAMDCQAVRKIASHNKGKTAKDLSGPDRNNPIATSMPDKKNNARG